MTQLTTT